MLAQAVGRRATVAGGGGGGGEGGVRGPRRLLGSSGLRQGVSVRWQGQRGGAGGALRLVVGRGRHNRSVGAGMGVRCKVKGIGETEFEEVVLKSDVPVLVDFWAGWCGPCKLVASSMDVVDRKYAGNLKVVKIETDPNPTLVEKYKVYGLPTLILFQDGKEIPGSRREGAISLAKLESMLKQVLPSLAAA